MLRQSDKQLRQKEVNSSKKISTQYFKIKSEIGKGTFGKVYLALWNQKDKQVALKHVFQNKRYKNRELEILREMNHPAIIQLYQYFYQETKQGTYLNLAMEYVPLTLSHGLKNKVMSSQFFSNQQIKKYAFWLLSGLAYLSERSITHRDIKPSNILIGINGQAKICDFGSAKVLCQGQKNLAYICSRFYRAPQLIFGAVQYSTQIDIWSLGCVFAQMLINTPIFQGSSNTNQMLKIIRVLGSPSDDDIRGMKIQKSQAQVMDVQGCGVEAKITKINKNADKDLIDLIIRMLVYDPQKRITAKDALKLQIFKEFQPLKSLK